MKKGGSIIKEDRTVGIYKIAIPVTGFVTPRGKHLPGITMLRGLGSIMLKGNGQVHMTGARLYPIRTNMKAAEVVL